MEKYRIYHQIATEVLPLLVGWDPHLLNRHPRRQVNYLKMKRHQVDQEQL